MSEKEPKVTDELEGVRKELAELKQKNEVLTHELESGKATVTSLEQAVASKDNELASLKETVAESDRQLNKARGALAQAVASYKELVIKSNPVALPLPELIIGDTIEAINRSVESARVLVDKVRQGIEAEMAKTKIPAGAPQRKAVDLSGLSAREKIQFAIGGKR